MALNKRLQNRLLSIIVAVQLFSTTLAATVSKNDEPATRALEPFTFDDIFDPVYRPRSFSAQWEPATDYFLFRDSNSGAVMKFNAADQSQTVFIDNSTFSQLQTGTYYTSPDWAYVLFAYDRVAIWRHSFTAKYKILNVATGTLVDFPNGQHQGSVLQYAGWTAGRNALTFVIGNNLYYQPNVTANPIPMTTSGDPTWIYNGIPDWLYEEDVLSQRVSHYSSPTGRYILFAELNCTGVPLQAWPWYGPKTDVYGSTIEIPYPKAGYLVGGAAGPNTRVKLYVWDTETGNLANVPTVNSLVDKDHYFLQVAWANDERVMVTWANRVQNESWCALYDVTGNQTSLTPTENHHLVVIAGWVEVPPATPVFVEDGHRYLTIIPKLESDESGYWRHLAVVTAPATGSGVSTFLTQGEEEVDYIIGFDENERVAYYIGTGGDPSERHLFKVSITGGASTCLTCENSEGCKYVTASISSTYNYYILGCRGPDVPVYTLRDLPNQASVHMLENNDILRAGLATKEIPVREFIDVPINGGYTGRAEIFYPPGHIQGNKYPLLVFAYAGPGSQRVMKTFPMGSSQTNWLTYLKSSHNIAVASVDGRGSMAAGDKFKFEMYRKLSVVEIEDQNTAGEFFREMDHVDKDLPLGIYGWSYGGGVAAHLIGKAGGAFTCGISVAPVTTKAYYDTAYTERYLGFATADDNAAGYEATDVMNKVANFHNKSYLIAHGTADDNVHYSHAAQLIRALSDEEVQFRQNMYVDQNHGISYPTQSRHLFATMTNFLLNDCWGSRSNVVDPEIEISAAMSVRHVSAAVFWVSVLVAVRQYLLAW